MVKQQRRWDLFSHRAFTTALPVQVPLCPSLLRPLPLMLSLARRRASPNHIPSRQIHAIKRSYWHPCFPSIQPAHCATQEEGHRKSKSDRSDLRWDADGTPNFQQTKRRDETRFPPAPHRVVVAESLFASRRACLGLPFVVDTGDPKRTMMERRGRKPISAGRFTSSPFRHDVRAF